MSANAQRTRKQQLNRLSGDVAWMVCMGKSVFSKSVVHLASNVQHDSSCVDGTTQTSVAYDVRFMVVLQHVDGVIGREGVIRACQVALDERRVCPETAYEIDCRPCSAQFIKCLLLRFLLCLSCPERSRYKMAYILPSTKAKPVKRIDQQGQEELEADDKVAFQQSADAAAQVALWVCPLCP